MVLSRGAIAAAGLAVLVLLLVLVSRRRPEPAAAPKKQAAAAKRAPGEFGEWELEPDAGEPGEAGEAEAWARAVAAEVQGPESRLLGRSSKLHVPRSTPRAHVMAAIESSQFGGMEPDD